MVRRIGIDRKQKFRFETRTQLFGSSRLPVNDDGQPRFIDRAGKFYLFFFLVIPLRYFDKNNASIGDDPHSVCVRSVERWEQLRGTQHAHADFRRFCTSLPAWKRHVWCRTKRNRESICDSNHKRVASPHVKWTRERSDRIYVSVLWLRWRSVRRAVLLRPDDNAERLLQDVSTVLI